MKPKRTPEEMLAVHTENARKAQERLARARDPLIGDLEQLRRDLSEFMFTVDDPNATIANAAHTISAEITARIERALSPD